MVPHVSEFSVVSHYIAAVLIQATPSAIFILQAIKFREIKNFLNKCLAMKQCEKIFEEFEKPCANHFKVLALVFCSMMAVKYSAMIHPSIHSLLILFAYIYPSMTVVSFVNFLNNVEYFLVASMMEIRND